MTHNYLSMYTVYYIAMVLSSFYTQLCGNNLKVTVNNCACTDAFIAITIKDQSGGLYNSYSLGSQEFMAISKQTLFSGYATDSACLMPIIPWHCATTIT